MGEDITMNHKHNIQKIILNATEIMFADICLKLVLKTFNLGLFIIILLSTKSLQLISRITPLYNQICFYYKFKGLNQINLLFVPYKFKILYN